MSNFFVSHRVELWRYGQSMWHTLGDKENTWRKCDITDSISKFSTSKSFLAAGGSFTLRLYDEASYNTVRHYDVIKIQVYIDDRWWNIMLGYVSKKQVSYSISEASAEKVFIIQGNELGELLDTEVFYNPFLADDYQKEIGQFTDELVLSGTQAEVVQTIYQNVFLRRLMIEPRTRVWRTFKYALDVWHRWFSPAISIENRDR